MALPLEEHVTFELKGLEQLNAFLRRLVRNFDADNQKLDYKSILKRVPAGSRYIQGHVTTIPNSEGTQRLDLVFQDSFQMPDVIGHLHPGKQDSIVVADPTHRHFAKIQNACAEAVAECPFPTVVMQENIYMLRRSDALLHAIGAACTKMEKLGIPTASHSKRPANKGTYFTIVPPEESAGESTNGIWKMHVFNVSNTKHDDITLTPQSEVGAITAYAGHAKVVLARDTEYFEPLAAAMRGISSGREQPTPRMIEHTARRGRRSQPVTAEHFAVEMDELRPTLHAEKLRREKPEANPEPIPGLRAAREDAMAILMRKNPDLAADVQDKLKIITARRTTGVSK